MEPFNSNYSQEDRPVILVIDDNEDLLEFLADDLSEKYTVRTAHDGLMGLEELRQHPVQLIISDVMMPRMNGFELATKLKSDFEYSHIPLILLTVKNTVAAKVEGLHCGADAYIEKPFSPEHLNAQIESLLNNRTKIKEYFAKSPLVHIKTIAHTKTDEAFLQQLHVLIEENITEPALDVDWLALRMNMSRPTLYRKIKSISNLSPNEMITITRLNKAVDLIVSGEAKLNDIAERVGFNSLTQLGRNFQKQFNMTPSEYARKLKNVRGEG